MSSLSSTANLATTTTATGNVTATATPGTSIGGITFNATARTSAELETIAATTSKFARSALKQTHPSQYAKLKTSLTQGSKTKFAIVKNLVEKDGKIEIGNIVSTEQLKKTIRKHIQSNDMADSFKMYGEFVAASDLPDPTGPIVDILEDPSSLSRVDIETVRLNAKTYNLYAPAHVIEDSNLVAEFLENCCNDTLKAKIDEKISKYPKEERGGVVFYYHLMELVSPSLDGAIRTLITGLNSMKLSDFDGENVTKCVTHLRGAFDLLTQNTALPHDIDRTLFEILQSSSTKTFNDEVIAIGFSRKHGGIYKPSTKTLDDILDAIEQTYIDLIASGKWLATSNKAEKESTFASVIDHSKSTCWNCGETGHAISDCSKAKDQVAIKRRRDEYFNKRNKGNRGNVSDDKNGGVSKSKIPPKEGETHERAVGDRKIFWCGTCEKWTNHKTSEHVSKKDETSKDSDEKVAVCTVINGATCANFI